MTQSFDEWKEEKERIHNDYDAENAWYAGAESRQAEIDALNALGEMSEQSIDDLVLRNIELQKQIDTLKEEVMREREQGSEFFVDWENMRGERDELQKRIDDLNNWCILGVESNMLSVEYNQALLDALKILKGESK